MGGDDVERADDGQVAARSIRSLVAAMPVSELAQLADALRELQQSPGYVKLQGLMHVERDRLRRTTEERVFESAARYAHINGALRGLGLPDRIIDDVLQVSATRVAAAERESA